MARWFAVSPLSDLKAGTTVVGIDTNTCVLVGYSSIAPAGVKWKTLGQMLVRTNRIPARTMRNSFAVCVLERLGFGTVRHCDSAPVVETGFP